MHVKAFITGASKKSIAKCIGLDSPLFFFFSVRDYTQRAIIFDQPALVS